MPAPGYPTHHERHPHGGGHNLRLPRGKHSPPLTMEHPSQWRYVATRLMAHMGAYTPDNLDRVTWQWHHRAALRIQETLIRHDIWTIQTADPRRQAAAFRTTRHQHQQSRTTQGHPRQVARTCPSQSQQDLTPAVGFPYSPQQSPPSAVHQPTARPRQSASPRKRRPDSDPPRRRNSTGGPGGRQAPRAKAAHRPLRQDW